MRKLIKRVVFGSSMSLLLFTGTASAQTVDTNDIVTGAVTTSKLALHSVNAARLSNGAVTGAKLATHSVGTRALTYGAVTNSRLAAGAVTGAKIATDTKIVLSPTYGADSGSNQSVEADINLSGFNGTYGAGAMGNALGTVGAGDSIVAGLIGKYNVGTNPSDHPAAGVVGEVGEDSANTADGAFVAVLGGDSGALDAGAAYGVRYLNSTVGSQFNYGLDLFSAAVDSYQPVTYATADIRLGSGATISSGSATPGTCVRGSLFLDTDGGADATLLACTATNTWTAVSNE